MTKRTVIILFVVMLLISMLVSVATVSGSIWYLQHKNTLTSSAIFPEFLSHNKEDDAEKKPTFHSFDKIVLSVKGARQSHFVMVELAVETHHPKKIEHIDNYMPVVRNALLKLFSEKTYEDLRDRENIDALQDEIKTTLLAAFSDTTFVKDIENIIMTKYVIQ